jgi:hypothetical protein
MFALGTDCICYFLPSDLLKSFRIICVNICDDCILSLFAKPWNVAIHIWGNISALPIWVLPRGSREQRGQNQDESGDLLSSLLPPLSYLLRKQLIKFPGNLLLGGQKESLLSNCCKFLQYVQTFSLSSTLLWTYTSNSNKIKFTKTLK